MNAASVVRLAIAALVSICGCAGGDKWTEKLPATVTASGILLLDGKPLDGATIVFSPAPPGEHAATSLTESDGSFSLQAFPSKTGAVPGNYLVAVSKTVSENTTAQPEKSDFGPDEAHAARNSPAGIAWKSAVPATYENPETSGLKATIPDKGTTTLKIELKSAP